MPGWTTHDRDGDGKAGGVERRQGQGEGLTHEKGEAETGG